jgi:hypothetical protein
MPRFAWVASGENRSGPTEAAPFRARESCLRLVVRARDAPRNATGAPLNKGQSRAR